MRYSVLGDRDRARSQYLEAGVCESSFGKECDMVVVSGGEQAGAVHFGMPLRART